jgi:hypothetical protein
MMHGRGKSSPVIVARKPANKAQPETVTDCGGREATRVPTAPFGPRRLLHLLTTAYGTYFT